MGTKDIDQFNAASCRCRLTRDSPHLAQPISERAGACREDSRQSPRSGAVASSSAGWKEGRCGPSKTGSSASRHRPPADAWRSRHEGCECHGPFAAPLFFSPSGRCATLPRGLTGRSWPGSGKARSKAGKVSNTGAAPQAGSAIGPYSGPSRLCLASRGWACAQHRCL